MTTLPDPALQRHFEALYAADDDPWRVRASWYERRKRAALLAALGKERYRSAFEPGCGNGELTAHLAARCDRVLASDGAANAVAAARRRLETMDAVDGGAVRIEQRALPAQWPHGERFDLVVVSELAYYFDARDWQRMLAGAVANLEQEGELLMCHYLHDFDDRAATTAAVHAAADALPGLVRAVSHRDADFLLETWRRSAP
jgi:cyclopropane fatty-acyl-phospholipid synthase-like methyltransferase